ncbi:MULTISPECIES: ABC transporter substrate-binding protein [unclassified Paenibacillus]|uniref:ABC transporter substrate-binding protein n=1 Tax=unclassified Paenibacillus TaxID=185978 RepID=UPI001C10F2D6|nr:MULTISPECIES: ABC transporter substrate-binding protein [unclassified Paenibacillus]MBU5444748.1 ABC transporter substrate-binding protein [Paenibacillus sp. MSJ-34]CAH0121068.1 sn-glycerol-3-phosphate-binding periplasmic protein UgpB [Paenibacillus sp. CECT 9249]
MLHHLRQQKVRIFLSMSLAILLIVLSACGNGKTDSSGNGSESSSGKITLSFWNGFTGPDGELLQQIVNDYNEANKGKVEIKMDVMPWAQLNQKLPVAISTDTAPSFVAVIGGAATPFIQNGSFQNISDFFDTTGANRDDYVNGALELGAKDGQPYLLPMQMNGLYLFWNKQMFKDAGLDPDKAPATLQELADYAEKLTDPSKNQYGLGLPVSGVAPYYASLIIGNGGSVVDDATRTSTLYSPENLETFSWLQDLVVNKKVSPVGSSSADLEKMMQSGQMAMYMNGPWMVPALQSGSIDFGIALPPAGSATQFTQLDGIGFGVPKGTSEAEKAAVYDFINYWNSPEIAKKWSISNGFPPYLKSVVEDPEVKSNPIISTMADMGDAAGPFLQGLISADRINNEVLLLLIEAVENGANVEESLKKASDTIDELLKSEQ